MKQVKIFTSFITLGQLLKIENIVQTGGETKAFLMEHDIFVDGILDSRRGRKLYEGTIVEIDGQQYQIVKE